MSDQIPLATPSPAQPQEVYATLAGMVDSAMVQRVFNGFSAAVNNKVGTVHLLIQSTGGFIAEGVALYNYLRHLPLKIVAYNGGGVSSIAVIVFLAAHRRRASETASFLIHRSHVSPNQGTTVFQLENLAHGLTFDDERTESILNQHITLPEEKRKLYEYGNLTISAKEAIQFGLIHEIADFKVPQGAQLYNL